MIKLDDLDQAILAALREDARMAQSDIALSLGVTRATVRARIVRMEERGDILGYRVVLREEGMVDPVRGLMMLGIEGRGAERVIRHLSGLPEVRHVWSTNGRWDVIAEIGTDSLERFDAVLTRVRRLDNVATSETSLLLSAKK